MRNNEKKYENVFFHNIVDEHNDSTSEEKLMYFFIKLECNNIKVFFLHNCRNISSFVHFLEYSRFRKI